MLAGIGASACLAFALAGCGNRCVVVEEPDCAAPPPVVAQSPAEQPKAEPPKSEPPTMTVFPLRPPVKDDPAPETVAKAEQAEAPEPAKPAETGLSVIDETPDRSQGEGTADWAVSLKDMPETGLLALADKPAQSSAADESGVPGTVAIDFPDENISPDDFGVRIDAVPEPAPALPDTIAPPPVPAPAPGDLPGLPEAGDSDRIDFDFQPLGLSLDPIPGEEAVVGEAAEEPKEDETATGDESSTTGLMSRYNLEFEEIREDAEPEAVATAAAAAAVTVAKSEPAKEPAESKPVETEPLETAEAELPLPDEDDFNFFGSLSESFFEELKEG